MEDCTYDHPQPSSQSQSSFAQTTFYSPPAVLFPSNSVFASPSEFGATPSPARFISLRVEIAPFSSDSSPAKYTSPKVVPPRQKYALATCSRINDRARMDRAAIMQKIREGSSFKDMAKWLIYEEFGGMDAALYEEVMISMESEIIELLRADQEALSIEAARYLEDSSPVHDEEFGASIRESGVDCDDESCMRDDSEEDSACACPLCHSRPLFLQMGWFMCVCGLRLSVKAEPISMKQLKSVLQQSAHLHQSSGCIAAPRCVLKDLSGIQFLEMTCASCAYTNIIA